MFQQSCEGVMQILFFFLLEDFYSLMQNQKNDPSVTIKIAALPSLRGLLDSIPYSIHTPSTTQPTSSDDDRPPRSLLPPLPNPDEYKHCTSFLYLLLWSGWITMIQTLLWLSLGVGTRRELGVASSSRVAADMTGGRTQETWRTLSAADRMRWHLQYYAFPQTK